MALTSSFDILSSRSEGDSHGVVDFDVFDINSTKKSKKVHLKEAKIVGSYCLSSRLVTSRYYKIKVTLKKTVDKKD